VYAILDGKNGRDQSGANVGWAGRGANKKTNRGKVGRETKARWGIFICKTFWNSLQEAVLGMLNALAGFAGK